MKSIFIISPHFPPSALPPSQRVRLIVRHCSKFGYFPYVFTVAPEYREEIQDEWMYELVGNDYNEITIRCLDQRITRKYGIGDLGLRMLPFLFMKVLKTSRIIKPDFILYPVPPWYILIVAPVLKWLTGIKFGIDFIDPWVHEQEASYKNFKYRASQWIARKLERWVTTNADIIFSVSEGINENLRNRHPALSGKPMYAVPYGAEQTDFLIVKPPCPNITSPKIALRYIGAIWNDCYPVLDGLMPAFAEVAKQVPLSLEFYGTSYAGDGLAKPQLERWINDFDMHAFTKEQPLRVTYKKAVELTMDSDILFIIGGMQPYYAASKLMGLVVSGKPFLAFLHQDSFPALFLKKLNYPYLVTYSSQEDRLPKKQIRQVANTLQQLVNDLKNFKPIDIENPMVKEHTAEGMTRFFMEKIQQIL